LRWLLTSLQQTLLRRRLAAHARRCRSRPNAAPRRRAAPLLFILHFLMQSNMLHFLLCNMLHLLCIKSQRLFVLRRRLDWPIMCAGPSRNRHARRACRCATRHLATARSIANSIHDRATFKR
jgi:hypothetical protein